MTPETSSIATAARDLQHERRGHELVEHRIKTWTFLPQVAPQADAMPMRFWALLASGSEHHAQARWQGNRGEAALSVLSAQANLAGMPVALSLLTPSSEANFEAWAIHRRAFDIAVNSLALA